MLDVSEASRHRRFLDLLQRLQPKDALEVRGALFKYARLGGPNEYETAAFWRRWAEIDPHGAIGYLNAQDDRPMVRNRFELTLQSWAMKDAQAAQQWLSANAEHAQFESAFIGFLDGYAKIDSHAATRVALASLQPDDPLFPRALKRISEQVFRTGSAAGLKNWPDTGPGSAARQAAVDAVSHHLVSQDVAIAADWVQQQAFRPWRSDSLIGKVASRYAETDPAAAMEWVQTLPPNPAAKNGTDRRGRGRETMDAERSLGS